MQAVECVLFFPVISSTARYLFHCYPYIMSPVNSCRSCGATSYKPIISRDANGDMRASGQYQCVGCGVAFADVDEWRYGNVRLGFAQRPQESPANMRPLNDQ